MKRILEWVFNVIFFGVVLLAIIWAVVEGIRR